MECEFSAAKAPSTERKAVSINSHRLEASHCVCVCVHYSCAIFCKPWRNILVCWRWKGPYHSQKKVHSPLRHASCLSFIQSLCLRSTYSRLLGLVRQSYRRPTYRRKSRDLAKDGLPVRVRPNTARRTTLIINPCRTFGYFRIPRTVYLFYLYML